MRCFVRQPIKGGRVCVSDEYYKSKICDQILKIMSEESNVKGKLYDIIEAYLNFENKNFKFFKKDYENQFRDYRDEDEEKKENFINEKSSQLPIHQLIKQIKSDELLWDYDANSLYPSTVWDEKSIYPRIETGYVFTPYMNKILVKNSKLVISHKEVLF